MLILNFLLSLLMLPCGCSARRPHGLMDLNEDVMTTLEPEKLGLKDNGWVAFAKAPPLVVYVRAGERVEITCEALGSPAPKVHWKNGDADLNWDLELTKVLPGQGMAKIKSTLILDCFDGNDAMIITCIVENGGRKVTATTKLAQINEIGHDGHYTCSGNQQYAPRIVQTNEFLFEQMGNDLVLPCKAIGSPTPTVYWQGPRFNILETVGDGVSANGDLMISKLKWADMGLYTCVAENSIGKTFAETFVYPFKPEEDDGGVTEE